MNIKVMLVDDNEHTRSSYAMMLTLESDLTVVAEASDGREAIERAAETQPNVILMDVRMPRMDGIEATRRITGWNEAPRVLVLTTYDLDEYAFNGLAAGASGFLLKDATPDQLTAAVRAVYDGDAVVTPRITRRMLETVKWPTLPEPAADSDFAALTEREREIARAITEGLTNAEIAERFVLTESTVKAHINRILRKLDARDRVEIVIRGHRAGLAQNL
ncbi:MULTISPECIES: response regulator [Auritidibacter]|uniref:Response regulator transcription factor n=1 Tax=Auritidibacter ignavus TaxID=678932 RepID=A0AAJ6DB59_9MICC|nr:MULTISPECIES: response regulator transcription factor [Auritidibacter]PXA82335.1 DNA-binding response regulator [Auritidibacter sp. NML120779]AXR74278.1 DNA-binding response regulator [Auritidibacter sp. NML130574]WGH82987.1 response regulator transcription factor [Auritidibacter ignavus]WGH92265.1 response regulator transcription factor [Auritidibacter ignavus]WHS34060.1 response regulator transcription factor [Auritidibacter ignavus]